MSAMLHTYYTLKARMPSVVEIALHGFVLLLDENNTSVFPWFNMRTVVVPTLEDNFAYLLIDESGVTAAIDPAEPDKVSNTLEHLAPPVMVS